ncbi:MAG TPA: arylsulfatase, partial [Opitutae bacterium]|nr:arylsulfatase [Opitutae bacterium]
MKNKIRTILLIGILAELSLSVIARPNVLVIMTDDQGYPEISAHGNPILQTPNLDRLHGQSIRFSDYHVAPMCTPTRGQLLTGLDA